MSLIYIESSFHLEDHKRLSNNFPYRDPRTEWHVWRKLWLGNCSRSFVVQVVCLLGYLVTELMICLNWLPRRIFLVSSRWRFGKKSMKLESDWMCTRRNKVEIETNFLERNYSRYHFIKLTIMPIGAFVDFQQLLAFYDDIIESSTLSTQFHAAL